MAFERPAACYPHFCVEHVFGHHKTVATEADPATARFGESLYPFWIRTIVGGLRSARALERVRVERAGIRPWSLANRTVRHPLLILGVCLGTVAALGPVGLALFLAHAVVAVLFLETINYIERTTRPNYPPGTPGCCGWPPSRPFGAASWIRASGRGAHAGPTESLGSEPGDRYDVWPAPRRTTTHGPPRPPTGQRPAPPLQTR